MPKKNIAKTRELMIIRIDFLCKDKISKNGIKTVEVSAIKYPIIPADEVNSFSKRTI